MTDESERNESELAQQLRGEVLDGEWSLLEPHYQSGSVILLDPDMDIVEVGVKVVTDDTEVVEAWVADGRMSKPGPALVQHWEPEKEFRFLIVQPYVLIQETGEVLAH